MKISRNGWGQLCYATDGAETCTVVTPVRAFPMSAPEEGVSLVDPHGRELVWFAHLNELDADMRKLIETELQRSEFMPEILVIRAVTSYAAPSRWSVETDRGATELTLKGEEDIRRLSATRFLIAAANGVQFLIRDIHALDKGSRKRLDRFL